MLVVIQIPVLVVSVANYSLTVLNAFQDYSENLNLYTQAVAVQAHSSRNIFKGKRVILENTQASVKLCLSINFMINAAFDHCVCVYMCSYSFVYKVYLLQYKIYKYLYH